MTVRDPTCYCCVFYELRIRRPLGPWACRDAGRAARRQRSPGRFTILPERTASLFAYLAYHPDRSTTRAELIEMFWPEAPGSGTNESPNSVVLVPPTVRAAGHSVGRCNLRGSSESTSTPIPLLQMRAHLKWCWTPPQKNRTKLYFALKMQFHTIVESCWPVS